MIELHNHDRIDKVSRIFFGKTWKSWNICEKTLNFLRFKHHQRSNSIFSLKSHFHVSSQHHYFHLSNFFQFTSVLRWSLKGVCNFFHNFLSHRKIFWFPDKFVFNIREWKKQLKCTRLCDSVNWAEILWQPWTIVSWNFSYFCFQEKISYLWIK